MDETITLTLNSPITEEQWDVITDVDFDRTDRMLFYTKHGKEVEFVKVIRCKECKWSPKCYGDIVRASKGGGEVHIPLGTDGYCSLAERKEE